MFEKKPHHSSLLLRIVQKGRRERTRLLALLRLSAAILEQLKLWIVCQYKIFDITLISIALRGSSVAIPVLWCFSDLSYPAISKIQASFSTDSLQTKGKYHLLSLTLFLFFFLSLFCSLFTATGLSSTSTFTFFEGGGASRQQLQITKGFQNKGQSEI